MNPTGYVKIIMSVLMAAIVVISVLVPVVYGASTTTATITNEGAGWAKFAYNDEAVDYNVSMSSDGSALTLGTQSGTADEMIVYASDVFSVLYTDSSFKLVAPSGASADLGSSAAVASSSGTVTVTDSASSTVYSSDAVTWSYVPDAAGSFGFFTETGKTVKDFPVAAAGSFAGTYTYNNLDSLNAGLVMSSTVSDGLFNGAVWSLSDLAKTSKKEIELEVEEKAIKSASSPQYTDGYWGFDNVLDKARIVAYSGPAGDIIIPAEVFDGSNTLTVFQVGDMSNPIFTNANITGSSVFIPDSVIKIMSHAFEGCNGLVGNLDIPDSVTSIGTLAFSGCTGFTGNLILPELSKLETSAFSNCTGLNGVTFAGKINSLGASVFTNCYNISEVLDLGNNNTSNLGFSSSADIRSSVPLMGYIAPVSFSETVQNTGLVYTVMSYIPVLIIVGLMVGVLGVFVSNRRA